RLVEDELFRKLGCTRFALMRLKILHFSCSPREHLRILRRIKAARALTYLTGICGFISPIREEVHIVFCGNTVFISLERIRLTGVDRFQPHAKKQFILRSRNKRANTFYLKPDV